MSDIKLTIEDANKLDENLKEFMRIRDEYELCRELLKSDKGGVLTVAENEIREQLYWGNDLFGKLSEPIKQRISDAIIDILTDVASKDGKILMTKYFDKV